VSQSYLTFCNGRNKSRLLAALMFQANWGWGSAALAILFSLIKMPTVCGAAKFEQKITEAPSFITIITSDEIRKHGYRTFAEVLRRVPGSTIETAATSRPEVSWGPGSYNDCMLIQSDGHRLNENVYNGAYVDTQFPVDLDLTKSVVRAARNSRLTGAWAVHTILV
jgi:outer membrane receptor for ferrienterochelin and colicin